MKDEHTQLMYEAFEIARRCGVTEWIQLKKIVLLSLPSEARKNFSTSDPITKKHSTNDFERDVIDIYLRKTGITLRLPDEE